MRATMGVQAQHPLRVYQNSGDGVKCSGEYEDLKKDLRDIREENLKLKAVISDVTEVNKRWQTYNNDRQIYVQRLLTTIQDQQDQINKMVAAQVLPPPVVQGAEKSSLQDVVAQLQQQIERLDLEHGETVEVLKFQVKAHHDDWEAERREKQQALQDKLAADAKIRQLQKELRAHKLKLREERPDNEPRCSCCCSHSSEADHDVIAPRPNTSRTENTKTYRTSVHVPCNAGHLLSRGAPLAPLSSEDDLAVDGDRPLRGSDEPDSANAVRIGFNDGLASVLSFSQTPIVKSLSLPNPTEAGGSPSAAHFAGSAESLLRGKLSLTGSYARSSHQHRPQGDDGDPVATPAWRPKYFEQGVDTETREDIICPVCGLLFPPTSHVKFLDHFGKCQNSKRV